ncbi:MAG: hypothetical protein ABI835_05675 [Chloroflexota bacterium]
MSETWRAWIPVVICRMAIQWEATGDGEFPYEAEVEGWRCLIRVNDFPAEPLYTLMIDGKEALMLEDWPAAWKRPTKG